MSIIALMIYEVIGFVVLLSLAGAYVFITDTVRRWRQ